MAIPPRFLQINSDNVIICGNAKIALTGVYLDSATVTYSLQKQDGTAIPGGTGSYVLTTGPIVFNGTTYTDGIYLATIESTVASSDNLTAGTLYNIVTTFAQGSYNREWTESYTAQRSGQ